MPSPSPVCSCVRVKRKCSSLPRALNIKCAAKLSFFLPFSLNQSPFTVFNIFFSAQNIHEVILWSQQNEIKFCIFNLFHQQNFDIRKVDSNFWKCKSQFSDKIVSIMYRGSAILQASHKNCSKIAKRRSLRNINTSGIAYLKCILTKKNLCLTLSGERYPIWFNSIFEFCQKMIHSIFDSILLYPRFNSKYYSIQNKLWWFNSKYYSMKIILRFWLCYLT